MANRPDQLVLREYADARARGDDEQAARLWEEIAVNNFDRVRQLVKTFRFSAGGTGLPEHEWGSAATEAYLRVVAMGAAFREREPEQLYAALATCVRNSCLDYGRRELRHQSRAAGSIDHTYEPGGEAGPYDAALAAHEAALRTRTTEAIEAEAGRRHAAHLVAWGIEQVANARHRQVLELTWLEQLPAEEIAERLGISIDNVYARRSRGGKELERILRDRGS
jgi:RNA polymerase sigma factor (sigma-70 family)